MGVLASLVATVHLRQLRTVSLYKKLLGKINLKPYYVIKLNKSVAVSLRTLLP